MTRQTRAVIAGVLACALTLGGAVGASYWLTIQRDRVWCAALRDLTARPVPSPADPAANPSRAASYRLYLQLVNVRDGLGC